MPNVRTQNAVELARLLERRRNADSGNVSDAIFDLQKAARALHRMDERACCEDLTCQKCQGQGWTMRADGGGRAGCRACAGSGLTTGRREARILERVTKLAGDFGLRVYQQGDCRGWPLYLIPNETPEPEKDASDYDRRGTAVCSH